MTHSRRAIELVSLDVDGTLYSIQRMILRHFLTILRLRRTFKTLHRVREQMRGLDPVADFRAEQARRLGQAMGIDTKRAADLVEDVIDRRWMAVFDRVKLFPGLSHCLQELVDMGIQLAIVSNYPVRPKLTGLGLAHLPWAAIINAEDVGALKPHPAAFELLLSQTGVEPQRVVHVGDLEGSDIDGALGAGLRAARFFQGRKQPATRAGFAFKDWSRFIDLLRFKAWL